MENKSIRIFMHPYDVNGNELKLKDYSYRAGDEDCTSLDYGFFEDLIFGEDDCKINM